MKNKILFLQLLITLFVLGFVPGNIAKTIILLPLWWLTFDGLNRRELLWFGVVNLFMIVNDLAVIDVKFFYFTNPDFGPLPVYEFFMWGFYLLHAHRLLRLKRPAFMELKTVFLALGFSILVQIPKSPELCL